MAESKKDKDWNPTYRFVFYLGLVYILLLGLFTFLFNNPI